MPRHEDNDFARIAVEKGYCPQAKIEEARQLQKQVKELGIDETLSDILIKRKFITKEQARDVENTKPSETKGRIANYDIIEKIGVGGMGVVFKARQISLDRIVALKVLAPKLAADEAFCERFIKEARAVAKLSHPNIIVGIDVGRDGKYFYFAMEYVEGETVLTILKDKGPYKEAEALEIALQMAKALEHAHTHGLVHRDIKPDNIMINKRDEAKLCDLGVAKRGEDDDSRKGVAVGTPKYIAPEQARGDASVDIRADIYALGASLYHMTTGEVLFKGADAKAIMKQHIFGEAYSPKKLRPELSDAFCHLLEKMMAKEAKDRQADPVELMEDIRRVQSRRPPARPLPPGVKSSLTRTPRRPSMRIPGNRASGRITTRGTRPVVPITAESARQEPAEDPKKKKLIVAGGGGLAALLMLGLILLFSGGNDRPTNGKKLAKGEKDGKKAGTEKKVEPEKKKEAEKKVTKPEPKPEPEKKKEPPKPTGFEPLDKALMAKYERPGDFVEVLKLFQAAEAAAPVDMKSKVVAERKNHEYHLLKAYKDFLKYRMREAEIKASRNDHVGALGFLQDDGIPGRMLVPETKQVLAEARKKFESRVESGYDSQHRKRFDALASNPKATSVALEEAVKEIKDLRKNYTSPKAKEHLKLMASTLARKLKEAKAAEEELAKTSYHNAVRNALRMSSRGRMPPALAALRKVRSDPHVAARFTQQLNTLQGHIAQVDRQCKRYAQRVQRKYSKVSGNTTVNTWWGKYSGHYLGHLKNNKYGPGLQVRDKRGRSRAIPFIEMPAAEAMSANGIDTSKPPGKLAQALYDFWAGNTNASHEAFRSLRGDKAGRAAADLYLPWMEEEGRVLRERVYKYVREYQSSSLSQADKDMRRKYARNTLHQLRRRFRHTEAYHAMEKVK